MLLLEGRIDLHLEGVPLGGELEFRLSMHQLQAYRGRRVEVDVGMPDHERNGLILVQLIGVAAIVAVAALLPDATADQPVLLAEESDV